MRLPAKLFLIDDDEIIVSILLRVLKNKGYKVRAETHL